MRIAETGIEPRAARFADDANDGVSREKSGDGSFGSRDWWRFWGPAGVGVVKKSSTPKRIQIELSREQCDYVAERAAEYGSPSESWRDLIPRDQQRKADPAVDGELLAGLKSEPMRTFHPSYVADLRARIRAAASGERAIDPWLTGRSNGNAPPRPPPRCN